MTKHWQGPDFLGVGPEKTGTSWINEHLSAHPDVWTHPVGEVRYFWEDCMMPRESVPCRFSKNGSWHHRQYRFYGRTVAKRILRRPSRLFTDIQTRRDLAYLFAAHDDEWYLRQFPADGPRVKGEISPQYFFLPEAQVARIAKLLPDCRIVVTLRDPVGWIWSFARMVMKNGRFEEFGSLENFVASRLDGKSFAGSLANWREHFGTERVKVLIYDDLCEDPWAYYSEICAFLGIEPDYARRRVLSRKINAGRDRRISPDDAEMIRRAMRADMEELAAQGVAVPPHWRA